MQHLAFIVIESGAAVQTTKPEDSVTAAEASKIAALDAWNRISYLSGYGPEKTMGCANR